MPTLPLLPLLAHLDDALTAARATRWAAIDPAAPDAGLTEFRVFADAIRTVQDAVAALRPLLPAEPEAAPGSEADDADPMEDPAAAAAALRAWATAGGAPHAPVLRAPRAPRRPSVAAVGPDAPPGLPPDSVGPYLLNAEFTNTQPVAFRWQTGTYMLGSVLGRRTFRAVYEWVLRWLFEADPARLRACVGTAEFVSRLHRPDLATNPALLHSPILVASDLHAEGNLAPHELAHRMRQLLRHYELPPDTLTIWVRPS